MTIEEICKKYGISNYTINDDDSIDVDGHVIIWDMGLTELPLKFNKVNGDFECYDNKLTSLKNSPIEVTRSFNCSNNKLTTLEGGPEKVGVGFKCIYNKLTDLKFSPKYVGGNFTCSWNDIVTLDGFESEIKGIVSYTISGFEYTKKLVTTFHCAGNPISSIFDDVDMDFLRTFKSFKVLNNGVINLKRLKYVMEMFDKPIYLEYLESIKKHYQLV